MKVAAATALSLFAAGTVARAKLCRAPRFWDVDKLLAADAKRGYV